MIRIIPVVLGLTLLTACVTPGPDRSACPPTVVYTAEFKLKLAAEAHSLGEQSAVAQVLKDYALLKRQVEACHAID